MTVSGQSILIRNEPDSEGMVMEHKCQMTVEGLYSAVTTDYYECGRPAKFIVPKPEMGVEYVCGIHARSLDLMYKRTGQELRCQPLNE